MTQQQGFEDREQPPPHPAEPAAAEEQPAVPPAAECLEFRDADGTLWSVLERDVGPELPWRPADHCLVFSCIATVRRVWNYPPDWRELPVEELMRLSWNR